MNTLAALLSKLQVKTVSPELVALCSIIDAQRFNLDDDIAKHERRLDAVEHRVVRMSDRLTRTDSE